MLAALAWRQASPPTAASVLLGWVSATSRPAFHTSPWFLLVGCCSGLRRVAIASLRMVMKEMRRMSDLRRFEVMASLVLSPSWWWSPEADRGGHSRAVAGLVAAGCSARQHGLDVARQAFRWIRPNRPDASVAAAIRFLTIAVLLGGADRHRVDPVAPSSATAASDRAACRCGSCTPSQG